MRVPSLFLLTATLAFAEVHTLTLRQAMERALAQNPDVLLAQLDVTKSRAQSEQTRDPFSLKLGAGSGLAYTYGFPSSIDGNAPAIVQARGTMTLLDRAQAYRVAQAVEDEKGVGMTVTLRQQDVAYRVASAFLDAELASRSASAARLQAESLRQVKQYTDVRVEGGREMRVESSRANLSLLTAEDQAEEFAYAGAKVETALAQMLGYPAGDRVRPALEDRTLEDAPIAQEQAVANALADSTDLRRLESNIRAKELEIKSYDASWLPRINLVSQYSVLSKFNNFDTYYPRFQRNNYQIGASIEFPIFTGKAPKAGKSAANADIDKLRIEIARTKARITADIDQSYRDVQKAERTRNLRRAALDVAREELSVILAQSDFERASIGQVEAARAKEQEEWIRYYDSQRTVELAKLNVRKNTGTILAGLR